MLTAVPPEQAGAVAPEQMVIVPLDSACVTGAEKMSVLIPLTRVVSASAVYVLPAVSVTFRFEDPVPTEALEVVVTVTKMVLPAATVAL